MKANRVTLTATSTLLSLVLAGCAGPNNPIGDLVRQQQEQSAFKAGVPDLQTVDTVTDEFGSYQRTGIVELSAFKPDVTSNLNASELEKLKTFIFTFITEEALDSIALDNESQWETWKEKVAPRYISRSNIDEILSYPMVLDLKDGTPISDGTAVVLAASGKLMPVLLRDGGARSGKKMFQQINIIQDLANSKVHRVTATGYAMYFICDDSSKQYLRDYLNDGFFDDYSELNDGKPNAFNVKFTLEYKVIDDDGAYKISGFSNTFGIEGSGMYGNTSMEVPAGRKCS